MTAGATSSTRLRVARVVIIGAGFAGIGVARRLRLAGFEDIVVLEREPVIGGSWRDNDYPGCTCDIPSNLYSFSFAPNPDWTSSFPSQAEILGYLEGCVRRWDLARHIELNTEVTSATWDEQRQRWLVDTTKGRFAAAVLIAATGPFDRPVVPDIPTLSEFGGTFFHSARWNHDIDVTAQRVAVIGTGASAVQIVPAVAAKARAVHVYQRTPPWVLPKKVRQVGAGLRTVYRRAPVAQRLIRALHYWSRELPAIAATWATHGRSAYLGTCVTGFPNLFLFTGPNSGTAHTSLLVMIEAQINYIGDCLQVMADRGLGVVEVREDVQRAFVDRVQEAMAATVWITGGCTSYYLDSTGRNATLWPGPTWTFRKLTRRFDIDSYRVSPTEPVPMSAERGRNGATGGNPFLGRELCHRDLRR